MSRVIELHNVDLELLEGLEGYCTYNGLDVTVDNEITSILENELDNNPYARLICNFETACLAPAFAMMRRGLKVDLNERARVIYELENEEAHIQEVLNKLAHPVWGRALNPRSPKQLKDFFYNELCLDPIHVIIKGERKESTNAEALEKLKDREWITQPFVNLITLAREKSKLISTLRSDVDADGRMRFSFNVGATETGRWSSSTNPFGSGTNGQNLTQRIRKIFIADPGKIFVYRDLSSAESRAVGARCFVEFNKDSYLLACDHPAGMHTVTAKSIWPELDWTSDHHNWRRVADAQYYRQHSYYDMAKRGSHATNYYTTPPTMAKHLRIPLELSKYFQSLYSNTYPEIPLWHTWNISNLQSLGHHITPFGRKRTFLGRPDDLSTWREAIANEPQSVVADTLDLGLWRTWKSCDPTSGRHEDEDGTPRSLELLMQLHDAFLYQVRLEDLEWSLKETERLMRVEIPFVGKKGKHTLVIPSDCEVGYNWEKITPNNKERNPDGMRKWKGQAPVRTLSTENSLLDRIITSSGRDKKNGWAKKKAIGTSS